MEFRSLLFVPGDRPERFRKALDSAADGLILDLEDSVAPSRKADARQAVIESLSLPRSKPVFVRINPIPAGGLETDLPDVLKAKPDGIVLPKADGAKDVLNLTDAMGDSPVPVLPIATETPRALFKLDTYEDVSSSLCGLTWGAEDLPAHVRLMGATRHLSNGCVALLSSQPTQQALKPSRRYILISKI